MIEIPRDLLPVDGRFGSGPSKIPTSALEALAATGTDLMGTSHRQAPVKRLVGDVRAKLRTLFDLPEGYEVVLGNGGSTVFWDVATFGLVDRRAQTCVFGEFSAKLAGVVDAAPFLADPSVRRTDPGSRILPEREDSVDTYAWPHNETSTGVMAPVSRVTGTDALMLVDATSAAGALPLDASEVDVYYFAPQKAFASDGGLWCALMSPAALERAARIHASDRWIPSSLDLQTAIDNSRRDQTYNTPALATLFLMNVQLDWLLGLGGLDAAAARCRDSAERLYAWADAHDVVEAFVPRPEHRSHVVVTVDLDPSVEAPAVSRALRSNGIVDVDPYRKLGRNQLRIATYPAVDPDDVTRLTQCIDHVIAAL